MISQAGMPSEPICSDQNQTLSSGYQGDASNVDVNLGDHQYSSPELHIPSSRPPSSSHSSSPWTTTNLGSDTTSYRPPWLGAFDNPPYKNPFHAKRSHRVLETPTQVVRPRTAPETSNNVQVPFTVLGHKRSYSEANLPTSFSSHISDSQPTMIMSDQEVLLPSPAPRTTSRTSESVVRSLSQASLEDKHEPKRPRLGTAQDTYRSTIVAPPVPGEPFFLRDRSEDWTSSPTQTQSSEKTSIASTASPSQSVTHANRDNPTASQKSIINNANSPIVVTSSSSASQPQTPSKTKKLPPAQLASMITPASRKDQAKEDSTSNIDALPKEVMAPEPPVGNSKFDTHITQDMLDITRRLPVEDWFRPVTVARDVKVLERGHWSFDITIASDEEIKRLRTTPTKAEKFQMWDDRFPGATSKERLDKYFAAKEKGDIHDYDWPHEKAAYGFLTELEFVEFWNSFSTWVSKGRGGWGIRMVRDKLDTGQGEEEKYRIRVFCWGEVLAYLLIVIWIMSNKVTQRVSMQWVAGDGTVIVQMRPGRMRQSDRDESKRWVRKGPEGEQGFWGRSGA